MAENLGGATRSGWVVNSDELRFPDDIVESATSAQATLAEQLAVLRGVVLTFPHAVGPRAGDRWIDPVGDAPGTSEP